VHVAVGRESKSPAQAGLSVSLGFESYFLRMIFSENRFTLFRIMR